MTLTNVCAWFTCLFSGRAQQDVWGADPHVRVCGVFAPKATSRREEGGQRVSGSWGYASGCLHSQWAVLGIPVMDDAGEQVDQGLALIPLSDLRIDDTWFVARMKGTGSNTLIAEDVFVPDHRIISVPAALDNEYATEFKDEALYRSSFGRVAALVLAGPQVGMARAAVNLVTEKAPKRRIAYTIRAPDGLDDVPERRLGGGDARRHRGAARQACRRGHRSACRQWREDGLPRPRPRPGRHGLGNSARARRSTP